MRKPLSIALRFVLIAVVAAACDSATPTGPSTVTIETPTPPATTTSIPPGATTTIETTTTTTTSIPSPATSRTYVAFGPPAPTAPSQLTLVLQPLTGRTSTSSLFDRLPFIGTLQDPLRWIVVGFYINPSGGRGQINGELVGTLDDGSFSGTMTADSPECVAEREFGGTLDPQFLRWTGGRTLRDCKGSPLGFNTLTMIATNAPPPTTTVVSSSTTTMPLQCSYALSANGTSVDPPGGQRTVGITTGPTCSWTVQNFVDWIRVQPLAGSGSATVNLTIEPNPGPPRSATVVIAGLPFVVNQGIPTTTTTTVLALADLLPVTPGGTFCRYSDGVLLVDIRNQGNAASAASFTRVFFDNGFSGATSTDRLTPALNPSTTTTLTFGVPESCSSSCNILIAADVLNSVQESNESNNTVTASCTFFVPIGN